MFPSLCGGRFFPFIPPSFSKVRHNKIGQLYVIGGGGSERLHSERKSRYEQTKTTTVVDLFVDNMAMPLSVETGWRYGGCAVFLSRNTKAMLA